MFYRQYQKRNSYDFYPHLCNLLQVTEILSEKIAVACYNKALKLPLELQVQVKIVCSYETATSSSSLNNQYNNLTRRRRKKRDF